MSVPTYKREAVNRLGNRLLATLRRCDPPMPKSLRLMAVRVTKESILRRMEGKTEIHPGIKKMAQWGGCGERQAQRNVRAMENWGLMTPVSSRAGGRYFATIYFVDPEILIRVMVSMGANPSPDLMAEIRDINPAGKGDIKGDIKPRHKGCHMSPRIRSIRNLPFQFGENGEGSDHV